MLIIAEPISRVEMLVVSTGRRASVLMLISGSRVRRSKNTNPTSTIRPAAISPSVRPEPQPQSAPREMPISSEARPAARIAAPARSTRPGVRTGDSGTNRCVVIVASTPMIAPSQKIQW